MQDIIRTRCTRGILSISDTHIKVHHNLLGDQIMRRDALREVDAQIAAPSIFGLGGGMNMVFRGEGAELRANMVKTRDARKLLAFLGYGG